MDDGPKRHKITLVIADDHPTYREGLRRLLEDQGDLECVGQADNGLEAVKLAEELRPDVAILDVVMPELNGIEAAREIGRVCPATQLIILSMHSTTEHIVRALQAGVRGYLLKESAGIEVVNAVRAVHAGQRYLSPKISDKIVDDYVRQRQAAQAPDPLAHLSSREREVLQLVAEGKSSAEIADILSLSLKTVETYRSRLMHKLDIGDLPGLVRFAIQHGLTPLE